MSQLYSNANIAAEHIRVQYAEVPRIGIILGSGLGGFAAQVKDAVAIPYTEIPGFPQSTVAGHSGKLVLGTLGVKHLIMTNAAGGINTRYAQGALVVLSDHINLRERTPRWGRATRRRRRYARSARWARIWWGCRPCRR